LQPAVAQPEAAIDILLYDPGMPAKKRPTPQDAITARQFLPAALRPGILVTTPSRARFCSAWQLRARLVRASQRDPAPLAGMRERFLPKYTFRGRGNRKLQFAVLAVAALGGGTDSRGLRAGAWESTSGTSSASSAWLRRTPTTAACWPVLRYLEP
jgi:hypothetical protein